MTAPPPTSAALDPHGPAVTAIIADTLAGAPDVLTRLDRLTNAHPADAAAIRAARLRTLVALVNVERLTEALTLARREGYDQAAFAQQPARANVPLDRAEIDATFALAVLEMRPGGDLHLARRRFVRALASLRPAPTDPVPGPADTFWAALQGLIQASDRLADPATAAQGLLTGFLAARSDLAHMPPDLAAIWPQRARDQFVRLALQGRPDIATAFAHAADIHTHLPDAPAEEAITVRFAQAVLAARAGTDPKAALALFAALRDSLPRAHPLHWSCVRGELDQTARLEGEPAATTLAQRLTAGLDPDQVPHDIAARARTPIPPAASQLPPVKAAASRADKALGRDTPPPEPPLTGTSEARP